MDVQPTVSSPGEGIALPPEKNKEYKRCVQQLSTIISAIGEKGKVTSTSKTQFTKCKKLAKTSGFNELAETIDTLHKKYLNIRAEDVKPTAAKDLKEVEALIEEKQGVKREREAEEAPAASVFMTFRRYVRAPRLRSALAATPLAVLHNINRLADAALSGDAFQIAGAVTRVGLEAIAGGRALDLAVDKASSLKRHRVSQEGE